MKDALIALLETLGYPVFLQGSLAPDEPYPDTFLTFWNGSADDQDHYDNQPINFVWEFDVNVYSTDPEIVNTALLTARTLLRANGWVVGGKGYDAASDEPTHTGRGITVFYLENNTFPEPEPPAPENNTEGGNTNAE